MKERKTFWAYRGVLLQLLKIELLMMIVNLLY